MDEKNEKNVILVQENKNKDYLSNKTDTSNKKIMNVLVTGLKKEIRKKIKIEPKIMNMNKPKVDK